MLAPDTGYDAGPLAGVDDVEGDSVANVADAVKRLTVCVFSGNPRTASLFTTDTLRRVGNGVFDYQVTDKRCPPRSPQVRMHFQKYLADLPSAALKTLLEQMDGLVVMGDEFCKCPPEVCAQATARQYFSRQYQEYFEKNGAVGATHLPLGPRLEFKPVPASAAPLTSTRRLLYNLIVSPTSPSRKVLANSVRRDASTFVHVTPGFAGNASQAKGFVPPDEYRDVLLSSQFTLCPAGHNPEAFRLFEACEAGSIPVVALDEEYRTHACVEAFAPLIDSGAPFVFLAKWDGLERTLGDIVSEGAEALDARQRRLMAWYRTYWKSVASAFECAVHRKVAQRLPELAGTYLAPECAARDDDVSEAGAVPAKMTPAQTRAANAKAMVPLITGCGRSGTLSLAAFLRSLGIDAVHEGMKQGAVSVSWLYSAPADLSGTSYYPFESSASIKTRRLKVRAAKRGRLFAPVVRVVRHPLKVISSARRCFCGHGTRSTARGAMNDFRSWAFVDRFLPQAKGLPVDSMRRSMIYWLEWNQLVNASATLRIEDMTPAALVTALGLAGEVDLAKLPSSVPREPHHVSPTEEKTRLPDVTWADVAREDRAMAERIFALAQRFGYEAGASSLDDLVK